MPTTYKVKKGDTANAIAKQYGFSNYKQAGINAPSGNPDLIREGEEITIGNYNPSKVSTYGSTSPVVSSSDHAGQFNNYSAQLDSKLKPGAEETETVKEGKTGKEATGSAGGDFESSGDPLYDGYMKKLAKGEADAQSWADQQKKEIAKLLPMTLANLDEQYKSSVTNINGTYEKLIDEQTRLNKIDVDRSKAYGVQNGAQYMPLEFTSVVKSKEQEAANQISRLEGERTGLLAAAKAARNEGKVKALRMKMEDIMKIEEQMRKRVNDLFSEVQKRYELTTKMRQDAEKKHLEKVTKVKQMAAIKYLDSFKNAKTPEEKDKLIKQILLDSGGELTEDDYYDMYTGLNTAVTDEEEAALKRQKSELDIANVKNTMYNRNRSTDIAAAREARLAEGDDENGLSTIGELLDMEDEDGTPYTDDNGFITPKGFDKIIKEVPGSVGRAKFLEEYGSLLYEGDNGEYENYRLTAAEKKKLLGDK